MTANINVDKKLLTEAMKVSGMNTEDAVLNLALKEYLRKNNLKKILKYRGKNIWEGDIVFAFALSSIRKFYKALKKIQHLKK